ncbi:MAG: sulfurtransferase [Firmicutes bacterium]|nr:sulfurtransferase [Bacillota bacterium]
MPFSDTPPLVQAEWLFARLDDPHVVILDCRWQLTNPTYGIDAYRQSHIPGARYVDLGQHLSAPPGRYGGRHPLPTPQQFQEVMESLGVDDASYVVVYDDEATAAARCWWLLQYFGHGLVSMLDGGYAAWLRHGYPVTDVEPAIQRGHFTPRPDPRMVADYQTVRHLSQCFPVFDARMPDRYHGHDEPLDAKAGHIPGAENYPYTTVLNPDGTFRPLEDLRQIFPLAQSKEPIVYCGSGVSACVNIVALRLIGADPLLYPGSWSDWIQHEDAPIAASPPSDS